MLQWTWVYKYLFKISPTLNPYCHCMTFMPPTFLVLGDFSSLFLGLLAPCLAPSGVFSTLQPKWPSQIENLSMPPLCCILLALTAFLDKMESPSSHLKVLRDLSFLLSSSPKDLCSSQLNSLSFPKHVMFSCVSIFFSNAAPLPGMDFPLFLV